MRIRIANSSAIKSWLSICVVSGFQVRPSRSTKFCECAIQSTSGCAKVMRVEVADRAVELAEKFLMPKLRELARETRREYRHLLADRRRRRFLAVRPRHHRMRFVAMRQLDDRRVRRFEPRRQIVRDELLQDERVGEVVDVLGGAREMHHLDRQRRIDRGDSLFDEILDRLDVVIGGRLEFLHPARIVEREVLVNGAELFRGRRGDRFQRADLGMRRERQVPFDLDADAVANQRELAEVGLQAPGARAVAAVDRRHRGQCRVGLGWSVFHCVLIDLNYATTLAQSRGVRRTLSGRCVRSRRGRACSARVHRPRRCRRE